MSLLSDAQKRQFRNAIKLVTDTFMVTPVEYYSRTKSSAPERWGEGKNDVYSTINLSALVEHPNGEVTSDIEGFEEEFDVKLTLNVEDLISLGLYDTNTNKVIFKASEDFFKTKGLMYKVTYVGFDGPLDRQDVLVLITGRREEIPST